MRLFLGIILGAFLTIGGAFTYDTLSGRVPDTTEVAMDDQRPMVNWDVVNKNWHHLEANLREMAARVHEQFKKLTG